MGKSIVNGIKAGDGLFSEKLSELETQKLDLSRKLATLQTNFKSKESDLRAGQQCIEKQVGNYRFTAIGFGSRYS